MSKTFEIIERVGISTTSLTDAIEKVVQEANTEKSVYWFEVVEQRGRVLQDGQLEYQVTVKLGRKFN